MIELTPALSEHRLKGQVREIGINPNYWYAVAWAHEIKPLQILAITLWNQELAIYCDDQNIVRAVENRCPHKGVALHRGVVQRDAIVCPYHGWKFQNGQCTHIPYFPIDQKLPTACLRTFPVREQYGIIFVFPGDPAQADQIPLLDIPQYANPNWLMIPVSAHFNAHYTICNENTMDVFHGYLHRNLQGWFDPVLLKLEEAEASVRADYRVSYRGEIARFLGLNDTSKVITRTISVNYQYPNYINSLQDLSYLYLMRSPISQHESRSFSLLFVNVRLPKWLIALLQPVLERVIRNRLFMRFLAQDIAMIESEYENYLRDRSRRYVEVNPAIIALQRVMIRQYNFSLDCSTGES